MEAKTLSVGDISNIASSYAALDSNGDISSLAIPTNLSGNHVFSGLPSVDSASFLRIDGALRFSNTNTNVPYGSKILKTNSAGFVQEGELASSDLSDSASVMLTNVTQAIQVQKCFKAT